MKRYYKRIITASFLFVVVFTSCKKAFFYSGINTDPTRVVESQLTPGVLLTGAEVAIGYTVGGDVSRFSGIMDQQLFGYSRQAQAYENYIYAASDFDNLWANLYDPGLNNLVVLKQIADEGGYNYYSGISRVLLAYEFGLTTDMWGDIPFSSALRGVKNLQPVYDKQQDIYPALQKMLDSAITELGMAGGTIVPGADDFMYGGSANKWTAFAYSLKARYYLHLSKIYPSTYADSVLAVLPKGISSSSDNASVSFFNQETQANPWYQYIEQRSDISYLGGVADSIWKTLNDPRASAYIDQTNDVLTSLLAGISAPVTLQSYTEVLFMQAEALSAKENLTGAITAYNAAVTSAFADAGVAMPAGYLTVTAPLTGATHAARLPQIMTQKYLALFTSPEAFNDWRRTGYPALKPITGSNVSRRFLYPNSELSYNGKNVPTGTTLFTHVWWDK